MKARSRVPGNPGIPGFLGASRVSQGLPGILHKPARPYEGMKGKNVEESIFLKARSGIPRFLGGSRVSQGRPRVPRNPGISGAPKRTLQGFQGPGRSGRNVQRFLPGTQECQGLPGSRGSRNPG